MSRALAFSVLLVTFAWVPLLAQVGRISGRVTDPDGQPIEGVTISIEGQNVNRSYRVQTNRNGDYIHVGISLRGIYRVTASKEGYSTESVSDVRPGFGDGGGRADFVLQPLQDSEQHAATREQQVGMGDSTPTAIGAVRQQTFRWPVEYGR